jgi:hypothetical protein
MFRREYAKAGGPVVALVLGAGLVFGLALLAPAMASAQSGTAKAPPPAMLTIPAGGSATLTVRGFCLDYGKPFPMQEVQASGPADDRIRAALNYSLDRGYTDGNPQQVELAIWFLRDNTWHAQEHTIAQEIVDNATPANAPAAISGGTSLTDAIAQNKVTVSAQFTPQTQDHFYGDGQAVIKNATGAEIQVYLPIGTVFSAGAGGNFQDLAAFGLTSPAAQVTGTTTATASPVLTGTTTATASPVLTGTATTVVTGTATTVVTGTATTVVTGTATVAPIATAVETPTALATVTTAALETSTPEPTATTTAGGGTLPQTGGGDRSPPVFLAVMLALALAAMGLGAAVVNRRRA